MKRPDEQCFSDIESLGGKQWKMADQKAEGQKSILAVYSVVNYEKLWMRGTDAGFQITLLEL